jgi:glycosyltransferase involved in cell wall biosynthesis
MRYSVTVLVPSIGRPKLLEFALKGLMAQNFKDFEIFLILRKDDRKTIELVNYFKKSLDIQVTFQRRPGLLEAYKEGISKANGDIIFFQDDDAVAERNCIKEHVSTYNKYNIHGVSGEVFTACIRNERLKIFSNVSEITTNFYMGSGIAKVLGNKLLDVPIKGQEGYLSYLSKAGYFRTSIYLKHQNTINSLLCMAANMSILRSVINNCKLPKFLRLGINFEQIIGWQLWKKGYKTFFNSKAKVYRIKHGRSMSRFLDIENILQAVIEDELVFYYLLLNGEKLSNMHRIASLIYRNVLHIKRIKNNWKSEMAILKGIFLGNITGLMETISGRLKDREIIIKTMR